MLSDEAMPAKLLSIVINYACVAFLFIPFRTNSISGAIAVIRRLFALSSGVIYINDFFVIFFVFVLIIEAIALIKNNGNNPYKPLDLSRLKNKVIFLCFAMITFIFAYIGNTAFIYAQF